MTESLVGRSVRLTGGELIELWRNEVYPIEAEETGIVRIRTPHGTLWVGLAPGKIKTLWGELLPLPQSYVGRRVRLTGEAWGQYGATPERGTIHTITHEPGYSPWAHGLPGIGDSEPSATNYYVAVPDIDVPADERRDWGAEWYDPSDLNVQVYDALMAAGYRALADEFVEVYGTPSQGGTPTGIEAI